MLDYYIADDNVMMIEADVILRGQNTADQQLTPIMARPPDTTSDVTLVEWLSLVKGRGKGLKLDFKSIEAVELSLQILNEMKEEVRLFDYWRMLEFILILKLSASLQYFGYLVLS